MWVGAHRVLEGPEGGDEGDEEDEAALREAIRLSLLQVTQEQSSEGQQLQQQQQSSSSRAQAQGSQDQQLPVSTPAVCLREPLTIQGAPQGPSAGVGAKRRPPPGLWTPSQNGSQLLEPQQGQSALIPTPTAAAQSRPPTGHDRRAPWDAPGSSPSSSRFQRTGLAPAEYLTPDTPEDEEAQLRRALALSLQEASGAAAATTTSTSGVRASASGGGASTNRGSHHSRQKSEPSGTQGPLSGSRAAQQHSTSPLAAGALGSLLSRSRLSGSTGSVVGAGAASAGPSGQRGSEYEVTMRREAISAGGPPPPDLVNLVDLLCHELGDGLAQQQQQKSG